ncbi:thiamine phosphate synthase [Desulfovibrio gilichinskyi]|uniref:Thiamine-phosphate synthase n=1 Tax=Desulfovibrio gilichinskyi TaxID=1519643 RepID=A0A1X7CVJ4_9BACT|nr:thiamine phosphate synthase [Desulfovibrio gilichinskyi]SMF03750.1 thiamine-phosphate diphosphorylase [Desulfovibrio gilichinskyi]
MSAGKITRQNILDTDIYCLTAEKFSQGRSNLEIIKAMLDSGIKLIQYREKEKKMGAKYQECLEIRKMTREAGAAFIINDDIELAILVEADGVHIGQEDLPIEAVRKLVGENMAIGLSTHSPEQARDAVNRGADYIGVGPIFRTFTKDDVCDPVGFEYLEYVVKNIDIPFVAIGGIKENNVAEVVKHGARCVALVTEIVEAENIGTKINALRDAMQSSAES